MTDITLDPYSNFHREMPEWVQRWLVARAAKDGRLFPEQAEGLLSLHYNHGSPIGNTKDVGYPSGYEREIRIIARVPQTDARYWVQPEEFPLL